MSDAAAAGLGGTLRARAWRRRKRELARLLEATRTAQRIAPPIPIPR